MERALFLLPREPTWENFLPGEYIRKKSCKCKIQPWNELLLERGPTVQCAVHPTSLRLFKFNVFHDFADYFSCFMTMFSLTSCITSDRFCGIVCCNGLLYAINDCLFLLSAVTTECSSTSNDHISPVWDNCIAFHWSNAVVYRLRDVSVF